MGRLAAYLASPLGFNEAGRSYYSDVLVPTLARVVEVIDPWSLVSKQDLEAAEASGGPAAVARTLGTANIAALDTADLLIAVLDGQEADSGTAAELGYAVGRGLTCFGLRSDIRETGEPGTVVGLQVEAFIDRSGGSVARSLIELIGVLGEYTATLVASQESPDDVGRR
jgi:nucleoside 2-deoxyribosyltransferase